MVKDTNGGEEDTDDLEYNCLSETVRQQYFRYLTKQLEENVRAWCRNNDQRLKLMSCIYNCAELLEERAIQAALATQLYQRAMIKIISDVKRLTNENCLEETLLSLIGSEVPKRSKHPIALISQSTQTETSQTIVHDKDYDTTLYVTPRPLDERIELMQNSMYESNAHSTCHGKQKRLDSTEPDLTSSSRMSPCLDVKERNSMDCVENTEDEVAKELAQLFSEEHTELDEIFGIGGHDEPDDPQISNILKEIANAPTPHSIEMPVTAPSIENITNKSTTISSANTPSPEFATQLIEKPQTVDLRQSLWPCELYWQRRILTDCLNRHDDLRWAEAIQVKFEELFGEDSDDEFAIYSPSTELDEVLIGSCIRRITPWIVKHLMVPLHFNLIANRYLFKQLAKHLARNIILNNQYPNEMDVKHAVENYFCLHQAVRTLNDIH